MASKIAMPGLRSSMPPRAGTATAAALVALAYVLAFAACGNKWTHHAISSAATDTITLRARVHRGPWQRTLSLKLVKTSLTQFSLCAVWKKPASQRFTCRPNAPLPTNTTLRLEQSPVGHGLKLTDSPGWGMIGSSEEATLEAALSNTVSGNRPGNVHYRVTLRDASGRTLDHSNLFTVSWQ